MPSVESTISIGGFHDDKTTNNPTLSKTFRTIRKHLSRTSNNENEITNVTEEINTNFPKQTITTVTIKRSGAADQSLSSFENDFKTNNQLHGAYSFEYMKDKFPKQQTYPNEEIYHQTIPNKQAHSTTFTTYHTRTVTVQSNSGAENFNLIIYSYHISRTMACCLYLCCCFSARNFLINRLLNKNDIDESDLYRMIIFTIFF